jgi:hypothetical protein
MHSFYRIRWIHWAALSCAPLALLSACASTGAVTRTDDPRPPKPAVTDSASPDSASKPMVTQNPDGTITVQKEPPNGECKAKEGLVIPPQIIAPTP